MMLFLYLEGLDVILECMLQSGDKSEITLSRQTEGTYHPCTQTSLKYASLEVLLAAKTWYFKQ